MVSKALLKLVLIVLFLAGFGVYWMMGRQMSSGPQLQKAAAEGDTAKIEKLVKSGADVNERPAGGDPPLVIAAENGKTDTVRLLLQKGADRNSRDEALAVAVRRCDLPTVQLLLSGGADGKSLLKQDKSGKSPYAQTKEQADALPGPCGDVIRALELSGITDKPQPKRKR